jgi:predicted DNA-binding transcriptional regulator AlpA
MATTSNQLAEISLLRIWDIIGDKKRNIPAILPVSRTTFLNRVKYGTYPQPVRLGARSVAWRVEDIKSLIAEIGGAA